MYSCILRRCRTVKRQIRYLNKYRVFAQNTSQLDRDQEKLRNECLHYWKIPDVTKKNPMKQTNRYLHPSADLSRFNWGNLINTESV